MPRRVKDPVAEHSSRLCEYMNGQPIVVLLYARYFGEYSEASEATMTAIDQDGFDITCQDRNEKRDVRVVFRCSMRSIGQVREELMALAKEAEKALRGNFPRTQGLIPENPSVELPDSDLLASFSLTMAYVAVYLDLFPNTTNPFLQWVLQLIGTSIIHSIVVVVVGLHILEAIVSLYYTIVVGKGFFSAVDSVQWFATILLLGYPVLFRLIALANRQQAKQKKKKE